LEDAVKITDAHIEDVRSRGLYADPVIELKVDEPVFEQAQPVFDGRKSLQYRLVPCGPFFAVEHRVNLGEVYDSWGDYTDTLPVGEFGDLNSSGLITEQLMPVRVVTPEDVLDLAMIVPRVRRLIRRHSLGYKWNVIVDEQAALLGSLQWRLELRRPVCYGGATPGEARCSQEPTHTIVHKGTHLTICENHLRSHQDRMRSARKAS
jgi:hypothetical protein